MWEGEPREPSSGDAAAGLAATPCGAAWEDGYPGCAGPAAGGAPSGPRWLGRRPASSSGRTRLLGLGEGELVGGLRAPASSSSLSCRGAPFVRDCEACHVADDDGRSRRRTHSGSRLPTRAGSQHTRHSPGYRVARTVLAAAAAVARLREARAAGRWRRPLPRPAGSPQTPR